MGGDAPRSGMAGLSRSIEFQLELFAREISFFEAILYQSCATRGMHGLYAAWLDAAT
jgi:hypothetical protein